MPNEHSDNGFLSETLHTPVEAVGDVLVAGSGSTGIAAAIAAARAGARVCLVDSATYVGGNLVSGLPIIGCHDGEKQIVAGVFDELIERLAACGGAQGSPREITVQNVDPEKVKIVVSRMLVEAGVTVRLHTVLARTVASGGRVLHAIVEGKGGRRALRASFYVDATGDGDLAAQAGAPFEIGRPEDGRTQACTLMFAIGGIDMDRFTQWGGGTERGGYHKLERRYCEVSTARHFRNPRRQSLADLWGVTTRTGERTFNATRVLDVVASTSEALTLAELDAREQVWEFAEDFLRPHIPGFERCFVAWTAAKIGVRETRRILGDYVLNEEDICTFRKFPDTICCGSYPIDVHLPAANGAHDTHFTPEAFYGGKYWTIPYRSLIPRGLDNVLMAGRCLSATHLALSAVRCMANTMGTGQAAGLAAALCVQRGLANRELKAAELRRALRGQGAWLGEEAGSQEGPPPREENALLLPHP